jgi:predicted nucleic acid-binding protein
VKAAFWDASAVVPLCCSQPATARGRQLYKEQRRMVVWWGTTVEARSALARLVREEALTEAERDAAIARLAQLRRAWIEIVPSERLRLLAERLPDQYSVRGPDAFQLAAALIWCREQPRRRPFVCFDDRLVTAATTAGFSVRS